MNKYLKKAIERDKRPPQKISPISTIDGEIFFELIELIKKLGQNKIAEQLNKYKKIKDAEFYELILDMNTNFSLFEELKPKIQTQDEINDIKKIFLSIKENEYSIDILKLSSIKKFQQYDSNKFEMVYSILINSSEKAEFNANILISFDTKKERDEEINKCKQILENYGIIFLE